MATHPGELSDRGRAALSDGDWVGAKSVYEELLAVEESADSHAGLAEALWWLGELDGAIEHREKAYVGFRERGDPADAFMVGLLLMFDYQGHVGNYVASSGWLSRLERLVAENQMDDFEGWLLLARSNEDIDPVQGEVLARAALEFAVGSSDTDLEICALSQIGSCLVEQGKTDQGIALLDEAMAGSLGGETESRDIVVLTSCNMMVSCVEIGDFDRATKWVQAADRFVARYGCPFLYAECRTIYGSVLVSTGDWEGAERELETAIETSKNSVPVFHAQARAILAHLRLAQGNYAEARRLVSGMEDHPWTVPVIAQLHLRGGRIDAAMSVIRRRLAAPATGLVERSRLDELMGEAELSKDETEAAEERARKLAKEAEGSGSLIVIARSERMLGRVLARSGKPDAAISRLDEAIRAFSQLGMTYETALTRRLIGEAMIDQRPEPAETELRAAMDAFDTLGAIHDGDLTAQLLRDLGADVGFRGGGRIAGQLTKREKQVLALVGAGLTNPEIADRLFISRRTVEHHVARVLSKLGVRNRVEAAEAFRTLSSE